MGNGGKALHGGDCCAPAKFQQRRLGSPAAKVSTRSITSTISQSGSHKASGKRGARRSKGFNAWKTDRRRWGWGAKVQNATATREGGCRGSACNGRKGLYAFGKAAAAHALMTGGACVGALMMNIRSARWPLRLRRQRSGLPTYLYALRLSLKLSLCCLRASLSEFSHMCARVHSSARVHALRECTRPSWTSGC